MLLSVSPPFLYQLVQPMSDVPGVACWLGALAAASRGTTVSAALAEASRRSPSQSGRTSVHSPE